MSQTWKIMFNWWYFE